MFKKITRPVVSIAINMLDEMGSYLVRNKPIVDPLKFENLMIRTSNSKKDINSIEKIHGLSFEYTFNKKRTNEIYEKFSKVFFLADVNGETVGYCFFKITPYIHKWKISKKALLLEIAVRREYRNKNIATRLLEHTIKVLKSYGVSKIYLNTENYNKEAISLYNKFGFIQNHDLSGKCERFEVKLE